MGLYFPHRSSGETLKPARVWNLHLARLSIPRSNVVVLTVLTVLDRVGDLVVLRSNETLFRNVQNGVACPIKCQPCCPPSPDVGLLLSTPFNNSAKHWKVHFVSKCMKFRPLPPPFAESRPMLAKPHSGVQSQRELIVFQNCSYKRSPRLRNQKQARTCIHVAVCAWGETKTSDGKISQGPRVRGAFAAERPSISASRSGWALR